VRQLCSSLNGVPDLITPAAIFHSTRSAAVRRTLEQCPTELNGSVSFRGKWCKCQTDAYQKLYQAAEIRSRSAATRSTWMTRRRASETLWLM
jgi:hypothetical protein